MRMALSASGASVNPSKPSPSQPVRQRGLDAENRPKPLIVLALAERLVVDAQVQLNKVPRSQRFRYGAALGDALYRLPELVIQAATARTKTKVYALCDHLRVISSLMRIGAEAEFIDDRWLGRINRPPSDTDAGGEYAQIAAMAFAWRARIKE